MISQIKLVSLCVFCILGFWSCQKLEESLFTIEYPLSFDIVAGQSTFEKHIYTFKVPSSWKDQLAGRNLVDSNIVSVKPSDIVLQGTAGFEVNYKFVESVTVYIFKTNDPGFKFFVADIYPDHDEKSGPIRLFPGIGEMKSYMQEDVFNIQIELKYKSVPTQSFGNVLFLRFGVFG